MKIIINREACIGAASCVVLASKTFELDEEGKARVMNDTAHEQTLEESSGMTTDANDERDAILEAARSCPTNAIQIFDDDGTQLV